MNTLSNMQIKPKFQDILIMNWETLSFTFQNVKVGDVTKQRICFTSNSSISSANFSKRHFPIYFANQQYMYDER